jgi:hypothetical protein
VVIVRFLFLLSPSRQVPGYYPNWDTTSSFPILPHSLFTKHLTIQCYMVTDIDSVIKLKRKRVNSMHVVPISVIYVTFIADEILVTESWLIRYRLNSDECRCMVKVHEHQTYIVTSLCSWVMTHHCGGLIFWHFRVHASVLWKICHIPRLAWDIILVFCT